MLHVVMPCATSCQPSHPEKHGRRTHKHWAVDLPNLRLK